MGGLVAHSVPFLVYYSREVRMFAWLVTVTCLSWGAVFSHGPAPGHRWLVLYGVCVIAMAYSHPLGLLMAGAIGLATLVCHRVFRISWKAWWLTHLAAGLAVLPWVSHYIGHAPELITGPLPLRFLLGMPIGFIGGNFAVLCVCALLIGYGLCSVGRREGGGLRVVLEQPASAVSLLIWLVMPPLVLCLYSLVGHPIFGPARCTLFVGPAYLILVARGLGKLPLPLGITTAGAGAVLSGAMLVSDVYRPDLKADWKEAAVYLDRYEPGALVVVVSADSSRNVEVESARYYLGKHRVVMPWSDQSGILMRSDNRVWVSVGLRDGRAAGVLPDELTRSVDVRQVIDFRGLRLMRVDPIASVRRQDDRSQSSGGPDR